MNRPVVDDCPEAPDAIDYLQAQHIAEGLSTQAPERRHIVALYQMLTIANLESEAATGLVRALTAPFAHELLGRAPFRTPKDT